MDADVGEFSGLLAQRCRFAFGQVSEFVVAPGVFLKRRGDLFERSVLFLQRFEGGLDSVDCTSIELDLFANVPVENAGQEPFPALDEIVLEAGWTRVHRPDGGDLGFGGVAGMEQR